MKKLGLLVMFLAIVLAGSSVFANINGAIFTTDVSCNGTNVNKFDLKTDVYLDGGPHKEGSAGLPDGFYYVQVTSPNGQPLGTTYGAANPTPVHVTNGSFDQCYQLWAILIKASNGTQGYDTTPNHGGVYKVWVTPADRFNINEGVNGFIHDWSKTDNFKVGQGECENPSVIRVLKFDDSNANGVKDDGENEINGWLINIADPCGSPSSGGTPFEILASPAGTWQICEDDPANWLQTALFIDGVKIEPNTQCAAVEVISDCEEEHTVIFGNIKLGSISACKFIDLNFDGYNEDEPPLVGIRFTLEGNDVTGSPITPQQKETGENGCVTFDGLLPGSYTLCEVVPLNWTPTTDICRSIDLTEGNNVSFSFGNVCTGTADFGTKGYWHNKNGLDETVQADFDYLNSLAPWQRPSSYFGAGDEPIDGHYNNADGSPKASLIPAAKDASRVIIAPAGTAKAEQSYFLVDKNGTDKREQLAQQLDAFIMNVRHRLTDCGPDSVIQLPDKTWKPASALITEAIAYWIDGTATQRTNMTNLLDALNNSDAVVFINCVPCEVIYPE